MRLLPLATALSLAGCATAPVKSSPDASDWRVYPLNTTSFPDRATLLVNSRTGDTWVYNSADQWVRVKRN